MASTKEVLPRPWDLPLEANDAVCLDAPTRSDGDLYARRLSRPVLAGPPDPERFSLAALEPHIEWRFDRASGPGGQNVNKVSTRVTLLLDFAACPSFTAWERKRIRERLATRIGKDERLRIVSQSERSQHANRERAFQRLVELLQQSFVRQRKRTATRPTRASKERRIQEKKQRGETKRQRRARFDD